MQIVGSFEQEFRLKKIARNINGQIFMVSSNDKTTLSLNTAVDDPNLEKKRELTDVVQYYDGQPLPSVIEISESGTCNRTCSFCPRSDPNFEDIKITR